MLVFGAFLMSMVVLCQIPGSWRVLNNQNDDPKDHSRFYNFVNSATTIKTVLIAGSVIGGLG